MRNPTFLDRISRTAVIAALLGIVVVACDCGGKKSARVHSLAGAGEGDTVVVEGTLSLRGSTPHTIVMLEMEDGEVVVIQSDELLPQLRSLSGMRVSIEGRLLPSIDGETPQLSAGRYTLLALPGGEIPIVGSLRLQGEYCLLTTAAGDVYWLRGEFEELLKDFGGHEVWVVGEKRAAGSEDGPEGAKPLLVKGYGVLSGK